MAQEMGLFDGRRNDAHVIAKEKGAQGNECAVQGDQQVGHFDC